MRKVKSKPPTLVKGKPVKRKFALPVTGVGIGSDVNARQRERARKAKGKNFELTGNTVLRALDTVDVACTNMPVLMEGRKKPVAAPVIRMQDFAALLNVSYQTLWRWTSETRQVPPPILFDTSERKYGVYHLAEARVIISVIGHHLRDMKYFRKDHNATVRELAEQLDAVRVNLLNEGETNAKTQATGNRPRLKARNRRRPRAL